MRLAHAQSATDLSRSMMQERGVEPSLSSTNIELSHSNPLLFTSRMSPISSGFDQIVRKPVPIRKTPIFISSASIPLHQQQNRLFAR